MGGIQGIRVFIQIILILWKGDMLRTTFQNAYDTLCQRLIAQ